MASSTLSVFLFSLFVLSSISIAKSPPRPKAFIFPIKKDDTSDQYYTTIQIGSNSTTLNVVIDLGGKFLWFNSKEYFSAASTYRPIKCGSRQCKLIVDPGCILVCLEPRPVPGCAVNSCADNALNPFSGMPGYSGLGQDALRVYSPSGAQYRINNFPFQFSDPVLREDLSNSTAGLIGLGLTRISLPAQLASNFKIPQKFTLCISSSGHDGNMIIGQGAYNNPFQEISKSLLTTPLIKNPVVTWGDKQVGDFSVEYFINLKSIKVGDKTVKLNKTLLSIDEKTGGGGTNLRTVRPYTSLHRSIYRVLIKQFVKAAESMKIKRVASVVPFGACFDSKTINASSETGPLVPTIDFVLQRDDVYWRFYGSNSMVRVNNDVMCLAFVEGEIDVSGPTSSIVVGGYQMENHLLEFDVASSKLGFSSSLLLHDTSCSNFRASFVA